MRAEERAILIESVVGSVRNATLAFKIIEAAPEIRSRVVGAFLEHLRNRLRAGSAELSGRWDVKSDSDGRVLEKWWRVWVEKESWRGLYSIALSPENKGPSGFILGVRQDRKKLNPRADSGRIAEALREYRSGRMSDEWPWYFPVADQYSDWTRAECLERLLGSEGEGVTYFGDELLRIADIAAPVIDREIETLNATATWNRRIGLDSNDEANPEAE